MSLRLRLALWYSSLIVFLLIGFILISSQVLLDSLQQEIDRTLVERANHVIEAVAMIPNQLIAGISPEVTDEFSSPGVYLQILDVEGRVIAHSFNLGRQELPVDIIDTGRVVSGEAFYRTLQIENQPVRLYYRPLIRDNTIMGVVQVGQSLVGLETTIKQLRLSYVAGAMVMVIFGLVGGWSLIYFGLRPLIVLTRTAQEIVRAEDLARRVSQPRSADELGELTTTFNRMLDRLQTIFEGQRRFLTEAAHELRTPLSSMLGNVDLLTRYGDDAARRRETITALKRTGRHVARLLDDLLLAAEAEAGWHLHLRPVAIDDIFIETYETMQPIAGGIKLQLRTCESAWVKGDPDRLRQVLMNLIDNAIKYSTIESVIFLDLWQKNGHIWIQVNNTHTVISAEALEKVFEPFFRETDQKNISGVGLGLAIVRWIVQEHQGEITVESTPDCGTTVTISLPEYLSKMDCTSLT